MEEYICRYVHSDGGAMRRVYHASDLPDAMAMHNQAMPEYSDRVISWLAPSGITFQMHDSKLGM